VRNFIFWWLIRNVVLQYFWTFSTKDIIGKTSLILVLFFFCWDGDSFIMLSLTAHKSSLNQHSLCLSQTNMGGDSLYGTVKAWPQILQMLNPKSHIRSFHFLKSFLRIIFLCKHLLISFLSTTTLAPTTELTKFS
jgi:hypothetical protein